MHEVSVGNTKVLYSYNTPVVIFDGEHFFTITVRFSTTTTRQINFYLKEQNASEVNRLEPMLFDKLGKKLNLF